MRVRKQKNDERFPDGQGTGYEKVVDGLCNGFAAVLEPVPYRTASDYAMGYAAWRK